MTLKELIDKSTTFLRDKKSPSARLDTELLFAYALKIPRISLYVQFDRTMTDAETAQLRELIVRRGKLEPVAYITGTKDFYKNTFAVGSGVLIPRPETESLVEYVVDWAAKQNFSAPSIIDLGAGTGCISISLAQEIKNSQVVALEKSPEAFKFLQKNFENLNGQISESNSKLEIKNTDVMDFMPTGQFDIVVSNPPYISQQDPDIQASVKEFEPATALFADNDGMLAVEQWSEKYLANLKQKGLMIFEIGAKQGQAAKQVFESYGKFSSVQIIKDLAALDRFVVGVKNG